METKKTPQVLVTGGSGFLAAHVLFQLLDQGWSVRTTLRSLARRDEVVSKLKGLGAPVDGLEFVQAGLTTDEGWDGAVEGCTYVVHVASPFTNRQPEDENELIGPARDGTLRVLRAARRAGVKRVVLTSSFAAIGYSLFSPDHVFTEDDWTDPEVATGAYIRSKAIAERAAWDFVRQEAQSMELVVFNPVGIFGPAMGKDFSESLGLVQGILEGTIRENGPASFGVVDVRDVAYLHVAALTHPQAAGQRYLVSSECTVSISDVAELFRRQRPQASGRIAAIPPPEGVLYKKLSSQKVRATFGWEPRPWEEALLASVDSILGKGDTP